MEKGLVSIILTCYNQQDIITSSLQSVLRQSYTNWECLIVDDGSTDGSSEIIKTFIQDDVRFKYIYQENKGVAIARNTGFAMALGDFINFLDGDDTFEPIKLERQLACFDNDAELDICICDHQHFIEKKNVFKHYKFDPLESNPLRQIVYNWHNGVAFPVHTGLYKRDVWESNETPYPTDYHGRSEDWIFNILVALKGKKYYFLEEVLCTYHHYGDNYTSDIFNSVSSAIHAAFYIKDQLPTSYQSDFIDFTIKKSMQRYLEDNKIGILNESGNWRLGNRLTKPFFKLKKKFKEWF